MSGKFRYRCNICYFIALLDIVFLYCVSRVVWISLILLLAGIVSFVYFLNAEGAFELPEDEEEFEIAGFFWSNDVKYEEIEKVSVEKIYRKDFFGIYHKDTIKKIRLRIETIDRVLIFDAKDTETADSHCFYQLCDYIKQRVHESYGKSVDMMKNA